MSMKEKVRRYSEKNDEKFNHVEWPRCSAHGCPLMSTVKTTNTLCQFHHGHNMGQGGSHWNAVTEAIKSHKGLIQKYTNLVHTPSSDWNIAGMRGWEALPMSEDEPASIYLNRFNLWIHKQINELATEILQ